MQIQRISWEMVAVGIGLIFTTAFLADKISNSSHKESTDSFPTGIKAPTLPNAPKSPATVRIIKRSNSDARSQVEVYNNAEKVIINLDALKELENMDFSGLKGLENLKKLESLKELKKLEGLQRLGDIETHFRILKDGVESNAELESLLVSHGKSEDIQVFFEQISEAIQPMNSDQPVVVSTSDGVMEIKTTSRQSNNQKTENIGSYFQERVYDASAFSTISLVTDGGHIFISASPNNDVKVRVEAGEKSISKSDLEKDTDIIYTTSDSKFSVMVKKKNKGWGGSSNYGVNIIAEVPNGKTLIAHTGGGHIEAKNVEGEIQISTKGGHLTLENTSGDVNASTDGGHINASNFSGTNNFVTKGGHINMKGASGNVVAHTYGGHINMDGKAGSIDATTNGGNINANLTGVSKKLAFSTNAGNISISVPQNIGLDLDLSAMVVDVAEMNSSQSSGSMKTRVHTSVNGGGIPLSAKASVGKVKVSYN